jgi:hypothetical protein
MTAQQTALLVVSQEGFSFKELVRMLTTTHVKEMSREFLCQGRWCNKQHQAELFEPIARHIVRRWSNSWSVPVRQPQTELPKCKVKRAEQPCACWERRRKLRRLAKLHFCLTEYNSVTQWRMFPLEIFSLKHAFLKILAFRNLIFHCITKFAFKTNPEYVALNATFTPHLKEMPFSSCYVLLYAHILI